MDFVGVYECGLYYYKAYKIKGGGFYVICINDPSDWAYPKNLDDYKKVTG